MPVGGIGRGVGALVALTLLGTMSMTTAADAHGRPCRKGAVRYHRRCVAPVKVSTTVPTPTSVLRAAVALPLRTRPGRHLPKLPLARAVARVRGLDALDAAAGARLAAPAQAASRWRDSGPASVPYDSGGWSGTVSVDVPSSPDSSGGSVTVDVKRGDDSTRIERTDRATLPVCPDAAGKTAGTAEYREAYRVVIPVQDGWTVVVSETWQGTFTAEGHNTDTGDPHDFDLTMDFLGHIQVAALDPHGTVVATNAPAVWTATAHANVTPAATHDHLAYVPHVGDDLDRSLFASYDGPGVHHVLGHTLILGEMAQAARAMANLAYFTFRRGADRVAEALFHDKWSHWDTGDCVKVALAAPKTTLRAGEAVPVTVTLTSPAAGVAPAALTASAGAGGTVAPASTTATATPLTLTVTAPSPFGGDTTMDLAVDAVSKQGHAATARITFVPEKVAYRLVYTHTTHGTESYDYDTSHAPYTDTGDYTETRDVTITATVALTQDAGGATYSGSAPLRFTAKSWSSTMHDHSNEPLAYPSFCDSTVTDAMTSAADGTLTASGFAIGATASGAATLAGLGETWHHDWQVDSGPCGSVVQDYPQTDTLTDVINAHVGAGDKVDTQSDPDSGQLTSATVHLDSGWTAGSGDVAWQRTLTGVSDLGPDRSQAAIPYTDTFQIVRVTG